jgi:hypothetical protein
MGHVKLGLAAVAAVCLLGAVPQGSAQAAQEGVRFHHGKRTQALYCLKRNHWWFYRPYTTAQEDFPRCEPYFHYLEPAEGRRGSRSGPYIK